MTVRNKDFWVWPFTPTTARNHKFYLNYTIDNGGKQTIIAEYQTLASDPNTADPNSERILLVVNQPFANHKGGQLVFGPDGFLYIGLGDGGSGGDPLEQRPEPVVVSGEDASHRCGSSLRIRKAIRDSSRQSLRGGGGLPEIFAYGLRNPWRFSFEPVTNRMFVADVGQESWEEIDILQKGGNFGWK